MERVVSRWFGCGALAAFALLCVGTPARALDAPRPESGAYSLDAFAVRDGAARLPQELLAPSSAGFLPEAGSQGPVELNWTAHEHAGFRGYRLTATIEGGPLSGVATQWTVEPGSGRRDDASGAYAYSVRLNLPVFQQAHVRAALEGVRADGTRVLLGVRDVRARPRSHTRDTAWTRASATDGGSLAPSAPQRSSLALPQESTAAVLLAVSPSDSPTAARLPKGGAEATRARGPPPAVA
ncbi:MAG: hypothetical protein ABW221_20840 [Vicinamibacteria bacterium]